MILFIIAMILFALSIIGLPIGFLIQMWQNEKELKKKGILPPDW